MEVDTKDIELTAVLNYAPEPVHKIDQATQKTVVVIGKEHFLMCKQLMQDNAQDEEYAKLLNIPIQKIRYFKHKMQIFEDRIRARRRAARLSRRRGRRNRKRPEGSLLNGGNIIKKKEMSAEERFRYAKELILENYSTQEIAKVLRVSERSITRFRRKINEQKRRLQEEGKADAVPMDEEEEAEYKFKFLSAEVKAEKINELYEKGMAATEIAKVLKISDRSVRRWKIKLDDMKCNPDTKLEPRRKRPKRRRNGRPRPKPVSTAVLDRDTVDRAKALVNAGASIKEMSDQLGLPATTVRRLVKAIMEGNEDDFIESKKRVKLEVDIKRESNNENEEDGENEEEEDDFWNQNLNEMKWGESDDDESEDAFESNDEENSTLARIGERVKKSKKDSMDPLSFVEVEESEPAPAPSTSSVPPAKAPGEKRPKNTMGEREAIIAKLLREKGVRAVDVAILMDVSERSVTRLLAKAKELKVNKYDEDIVEHVNDLIDNKEEILERKMKTMPVLKESKGYDDTKRKTGMRLLAMNVKPKDIAKMLNVSDKTIKRWQMRLEVEQAEMKKKGGSSGHEIFNELLSMKEEPAFEIDDDDNDSDNDDDDEY